MVSSIKGAYNEIEDIGGTQKKKREFGLMVLGGKEILLVVDVHSYKGECFLNRPGSWLVQKQSWNGIRASVMRMNPW